MGIKHLLPFFQNQSYDLIIKNCKFEVYKINYCNRLNYILLMIYVFKILSIINVNKYG